MVRAMLVKVLIGVAIVLVAFVVVVATRQAAYHVERKIDVAAPPDVVFAVLNDLHRFAGIFFLFGEPFAKAGAQTTFAGPAAGAGQSLAWSGKDAGEGTLTIAEGVPGQKVGMKLEFVKPMASTALYAITLAGTPTGTSVAWSMDGSHNFLGKAMGLFMDMDKVLGGDLEKTLAQLKSVAEAH
jgi:hypothetical protein